MLSPDTRRVRRDIRVYGILAKSSPGKVADGNTDSQSDDDMMLGGHGIVELWFLPMLAVVIGVKTNADNRTNKHGTDKPNVFVHNSTVAQNICRVN